VNDSVIASACCKASSTGTNDREDEFFYVVEGRFIIDLEGRTVELAPRQGFTVPRGVLHRTRAPVRSVILMFESAGVVPTGDA
jgi:mannose-6-phosphate isomerase-like protein (cupin superfamily)